MHVAAGFPVGSGFSEQRTPDAMTVFSQSASAADSAADSRRSAQQPAWRSGTAAWGVPAFPEQRPTRSSVLNDPTVKSLALTSGA